MRQVGGAWRAFVLALFVAGAEACHDDPPADAPLVVADGCQPLLAGTTADPASQAPCFLPYPSDFHRVPDATMPSGFRIALAAAAKPRRTTGAVADPHDAYVPDGASTIPAMVATLPAALSRDGLPGVTADPNGTLHPESTTVLIEADTGAFVAHYTDLDEDDDDPTHAGIVLRPLAPLRPRTRYVAALAGVHAAGGGIAPAAEGFRRLRDHATSKDPSLAALSDRFERDVFAPLARAGVARDRLQLAWDFTTGSTERPTGDMLRVVDLTRAWLAAQTPDVRVTQVEDEPSGRFRRVLVTITAPSFLDDAGTKAHLFRGPDGAVAQHGTTDVEVLVIVPSGVRDGAAPGRAVAMGHGFFGGKTELDGAPARTISERLGAVLFGIDWVGMSRADLGAIIEAFDTAPEHVADFAERVHQAMANWLVVTSLVPSRFAALPELRRKDGGPLYDPSFVGYFGASQAHILGGTLVAIDPDLARAVLNVGGGGFVHIMPRSGAFGTFALALRATFPDSLTRLGFEAMIQSSLDRIDPITWAPRVGPRAVLQTGLGDNAVPNVAAFLHARALGARQTVPAPMRIFGVPETNGGDSGPSITVFDYGNPPPTDVPQPANPNPVHDILRTNDAAIRQMDAFLRPGGTVIQPCDGPCDPT